MGGVGVEVEAAEVRHGNVYPPPWLRHAVQLLHDTDHLRKVLDYMLAHDPVERGVRERVRKDVQIPHHIRVNARVDIKRHRPRDLALPGPDVEYRIPSTEYRVGRFEGWPV